MRSLVVIGAVLGLLAPAGVSFSASPNGSAYVLRLTDLPAGWAVESQGPRSNAQTAKETGDSVRLYRTWGRLTGWDIAFMREGGLGGLLTQMSALESSASLYRTAKGAQAAWLYGEKVRARRSLPAGTTRSRLSLGAPVGHASSAYAFTIKNGAQTSMVVAVVWRRGRVFASVIGAGLEGTVDAARVIGLARAQERRIARLG
jgi:hypothetical protein